VTTIRGRGLVGCTGKVTSLVGNVAVRQPHPPWPGRSLLLGINPVRAARNTEASVLAQNMGVDPQRNGRISVAEPGGYDVHRDPGQQQCSGVQVAMTLAAVLAAAADLRSYWRNDDCCAVVVTMFPTADRP
jgi:hypothetical protein